MMWNVLEEMNSESIKVFGDKVYQMTQSILVQIQVHVLEGLSQKMSILSNVTRGTKGYYAMTALKNQLMGEEDL